MIRKLVLAAAAVVTLGLGSAAAPDKAEAGVAVGFSFGHPGYYYGGPVYYHSPRYRTYRRAYRYREVCRTVRVRSWNGYRWVTKVRRTCR